MRMGFWGAVFVALVASTMGVGCADEAASNDEAESPSNPKNPSEQGGPIDTDVPELPPTALLERPWEVVSNKGETYLANIFYADPIENEQIMPTAIDGHAQIDRLIYPTIGNPNLYVKGDAQDELVMVLRLEDNAYSHLSPSFAAPTPDSPLSAVTLDEDNTKGISFFLVAKSARASSTDSIDAVNAKAGVFEIKPSKILRSPEPSDMPAQFKSRKTLRFVFDKAAMANVPPGLYDSRFEVRKDSKLFANVFEYQFNAVRVFENPSDEYTAVNVTDTQVATGGEYSGLTADKLDDFVDGLNKSTDPAVKSAAFITFNGDLHNGGSPGSIRQAIVARTYNDEAKRILNALKRLNTPIFLTTGNHDGYAAIGHVPGPVKSVDSALGTTLESVIEGQNNRAWPEYSWPSFSSFLDKTLATPGGLHKNIEQGAFERKPTAETFAGSFKEVPRDERNMILYDGFYQWQKTYGPLYTSWTFGKNRYVSINSYELRQHRRTGWGMYTVNYGGGISRAQLEWFDREIARSKNANEDLIVLMHHDPRGGHKGEDFGYYSPTLEYRDVAQSTINYILNDKLVALVCKQPDWSLSIDERESCLHDGLQEWMGPDSDFDKEGSGFYMSGLELLKRFIKAPHARTLVLGHVHFNSLEVLQPGDALIPNGLKLDEVSKKESARIEAANPVRRISWEDSLTPSKRQEWRFGDANMVKVQTSLDEHSFDSWRVENDRILRAATKNIKTTFDAPMGNAAARELAIVRFTSGADLTSQTHDGDRMFGYSLMHITNQTDAPRLNRLTYFIHKGTDSFAKIDTVDIDRTKSVMTRGAKNPVDDLFDW